MAKKPRLSDFGRTSNVTANALTNLLKQVRGEVLPDAISQASQRRCRQSIVFERTAYGEILQTVDAVFKDSSVVQIYAQHPLAMLSKVLEVSAEFRNIFVAMLNRVHNVIRICLYSDEVTPGNPLETSNDRKLQAMYWHPHLNHQQNG